MFAPLVLNLVVGVRINHVPDFVVRQAGMGVNNPFHELVARNTPGFGDGHFTDHGQAVNVRVQRAQTVRQFLWQHRHNEARKIHRCRALIRLIIEGGFHLHIMRDIGNGHP